MHTGKSVIFATFGPSRPWPWIGTHGVPSCICHPPLPTYKISFKSENYFVDGRMDARADGHWDRLY